MAELTAESVDAMRDAFALMRAVAEQDGEAVYVLLQNMGDPQTVAFVLAAQVVVVCHESGTDIRAIVDRMQHGLPG
jgi:hypothetical protein